MKNTGCNKQIRTLEKEDGCTMPAKAKSIPKKKLEKIIGLKESIYKDHARYVSHIADYQNELYAPQKKFYDLKQPLNYPAHFTAGKIARRISEKCKALIKLKPSDRSMRKMRLAYTNFANHHEKYAAEAKLNQPAGKTYQERALDVEKNSELRKQDLKWKALRDELLNSAKHIETKIKGINKNEIAILARHHKDIEAKLTKAAIYTKYFEDEGKGNVPTMRGFLEAIKRHGDRWRKYEKQAVAEAIK